MQLVSVGGRHIYLVVLCCGLVKGFILVIGIYFEFWCCRLLSPNLPSRASASRIVNKGMHIRFDLEVMSLRVSLNRTIRASPTVWILILPRKLVGIVHIRTLEFVFYLFLVYFQLLLNNVIYELGTYGYCTPAFLISSSCYVIIGSSTIWGEDTSVMSLIWIMCFLQLLVILCEQLQGFHHWGI